jgi:hypothetical protein
MTTELRYDRWFLPFSVPVGLGPQRSTVRIDGSVLHVAMGWGFSADIPLASITDASPYTGRVTAWGAHGWRGRWLVNGSSNGLVVLTIESELKAKVMGVPVAVRELCVSVTDPDALIASVTAKAG